jgi:hypothetical protein
MPQNPGPIPFPQLPDIEGVREREKARIEAQIGMVRALGSVAASGAWPPLVQALETVIAHLLAKLVTEPKHEEIIRLQAEIQAIRNLLSIPVVAATKLAQLQEKLKSVTEG